MLLFDPSAVAQYVLCSLLQGSPEPGRLPVTPLRFKWKAKIKDSKGTSQWKESRYQDRSHQKDRQNKRTTTKLKGPGDKACQEQSASPHSSRLSTVYQECNQHLPVLQRVQHQPSAAATSFPSQSEQKGSITLQLQIFGKDVSYEEHADKG